MTQLTIACPTRAIAELSGNALRVYLTFKTYIQAGGDQVATITQLSQFMVRDAIDVKCDLLELTMKGWLEISLHSVNEFFYGERLETMHWRLIAEANHRQLVEQVYWQSLLADLENLSEHKECRFARVHYRLQTLAQNSRALRQQFS